MSNFFREEIPGEEIWKAETVLADEFRSSVKKFFKLMFRKTWSQKSHRLLWTAFLAFPTKYCSSLYFLLVSDESLELNNCSSTITFRRRLFLSLSRSFGGWFLSRGKKWLAPGILMWNFPAYWTHFHNFVANWPHFLLPSSLAEEFSPVPCTVGRKRMEDGKKRQLKKATSFFTTWKYTSKPHVGSG